MERQQLQVPAVVLVGEDIPAAEVDHRIAAVASVGSQQVVRHTMVCDHAAMHEMVADSMSTANSASCSDLLESSERCAAEDQVACHME